MDERISTEDNSLAFDQTHYGQITEDDRGRRVIKLFSFESLEKNPDDVQKRSI